VPHIEPAKECEADPEHETGNKEDGGQHAAKLSTWLTKNVSSSNEISFCPLSFARSGNKSLKLLAMSSVACR
jgi:hypothetical protein